MITGACTNDSIHTLSVDRLKKNKNDLPYNYLPRTIYQEYMGPPGLYKAKRATFQAAMKLTILIGQCFGLNPVLGVCDIDTSKLRFSNYDPKRFREYLKDPCDLVMKPLVNIRIQEEKIVRFSFFSGRCIYSIISILGQGILLCFCILQLFKDSDASLSSSTSLVFYTTNFLTTVMFLRIAMKWPKLSQRISRSEAADPVMDYSLIRKCNISCVLIMSLALLEHILADLSEFAAAINCHPNKGLYEGFVVQSFPWIWTFIDYNPIFGALCQFFDIQCTFNWNFADVFVICVSLYLSSRLEQVTKRVNDVRGKFVSASFWRIMREDYTRIISLVRKLDDAVSGVIFISFANNLFFICLQLLHTLEDGIKATPLCNNNSDDRPMHGYEQAIYFVYSFSFLLTRSMVVSLVAAKVHTASREPAQALYDVPSSAYCTEVQRFLNQVHGDTVALSGLQFFNVKRGLVLSIAGTIVTYELVLMQFAGVSATKCPPVASNSSA